jgi:hypothetical protein
MPPLRVQLDFVIVVPSTVMSSEADLFGVFEIVFFFGCLRPIARSDRISTALRLDEFTFLLVETSRRFAIAFTLVLSRLRFALFLRHYVHSCSWRPWRR